MRLIDADKLMEKLGECFYDTTNPAARRAAHDTMALCQSLVEEQPTAYDVDQIVERLIDINEDDDICEKFKNKDRRHCKNAKGCFDCAIREAIEIIKSGTGSKYEK